MNQRIFPCFLLLLCLPMAGQQSNLFEAVKKGSLIGGGAEEYLNAAIASPDGRIAAVGFGSRSVQGSKDDLLFLLADGQTLAEESIRFIGRAEKDEAYAIANRPEGGFLVAGYSTTLKQGAASIRNRYAGGKDAWLLWLNAKGETEAELLLGGSEDDELRFLHPLSDSTWLAAGNRGRQAWLTKVSGGKRQELIWEKRYQYQKSPTTLRAAAVNDRHGVLLCGFTGDEEQGRLWLMGLDTAGNLRFNARPLGEEPSWGHAVAALPDGRWAIAGRTAGVEGRGDGLLVIVDSLGRLEKRVVLGGREFDHLTAVVADPRGNLLLLGESLSHQRGARLPKIWMLRYSLSSGEVKEESFFGSKLEEQARHISLQRGGQWIAVGSSSQQLLKNRQAALWHIGSWKDEDINDTPAFTASAPREQSSHAFAIHRIPGKGWQRNGLQFRLRQHRPPNRELSIVAPPYSEGSAPELWFPLGTAIDGTWSLGVHDENNQLLGPAIDLDFGTSQARVAAPFDLAIQAIEGVIAADQVVKLTLKISNRTPRGEAMKIRLAPSAYFSAAQEVSLPTLEGGGALVYEWPLRIKDVPQAASLHFSLVNANEVVLQHASFDLQSLEMLQTGSPAQTPAGNIVISWLNPNTDLLERPELIWNEAAFTIQLKIISSHRLDKGGYCLTINGQACPGGEKMDEISFAGDDYSQTVTQKIQLQRGKNTLVAAVENAVGKATTDTLTVIYEPGKPNLHLLSIGIPSYNLDFTTNDARDVATLFTQNSQYSAFGHVFVDTLLRPETTTKTAILKSLRRLNYRMEKQQIRPQDVLLVFISSHGIADQDGHFRFAASDYDQPFLEETSIEFGTELKDYLEQINCRKVFFVDACHSGQAVGQADRADLLQFLDPAANINMMLSCRADEYSYENTAWQNGAFTEALLSVVGEFISSPSGIDTDGDGQLDLLELYQALEPRANELSQKIRPKTRTTQHPVLNARPELADLVLFRHPNN